MALDPIYPAEDFTKETAGDTTFVEAGTVPSDTVTDETTWGIPPNAGVSPNYSRADHTHGTPAEPAGGGGTLTGDVTGPITNNVLTSINGYTIDYTDLSSGDVLVFNGTDWVAQPPGTSGLPNFTDKLILYGDGTSVPIQAAPVWIDYTAPVISPPSNEKAVVHAGHGVVVDEYYADYTSSAQQALYDANQLKLSFTLVTLPGIYPVYSHRLVNNDGTSDDMVLEFTGGTFSDQGADYSTFKINSTLGHPIDIGDGTTRVLIGTMSTAGAAHEMQVRDGTICLKQPHRYEIRNNWDDVLPKAYYFGSMWGESSYGTLGTEKVGGGAVDAIGWGESGGDPQVGFFGKTPTSQPVVLIATDTAVYLAHVVEALVNLGLFTTTGP